MKLSLKESDLKKVYTLLDNKEINISLASLLIDFFSYVDVINEAKDKDEYLSKMYEFWNFNQDLNEISPIIDYQIASCLKEINPSILLDNPYYQKVKIIAVNKGPYALKYESYEPYQGFSYDEIVVDDNYKEISKVGYFSQKIDYLVLQYKNDVWMSITPNEILTMAPSIKEAKGDVLIYGLGLGYFPFMILNKKEVTSLTIIEKEKEVISLFKENILPFFNKDKPLTIIEADALSYKVNKHYDFVFVDLWHDPLDGLPLYIHFKKKEKEFKGVNVHYWLEPSILALYRRYLLTIIEESLLGYKDKDYTKIANDDDKIINHLYFQTKNLVFHTYEEIHDFLSDENIKELMLL